MLVDVESVTKEVHYIRGKASPLGHESDHANTRLLKQHLHVNCALSIEHVQADICKDHSRFIQACVQG